MIYRNVFCFYNTWYQVPGTRYSLCSVDWVGSLMGTVPGGPSMYPGNLNDNLFYSPFLLPFLKASIHCAACRQDPN